MRLGLFAVVALLAGGGSAVAADPAIVFQAHPFGQVLDNLRLAMDLIAGEKGVKVINKNLHDVFGEKGFEGLDIGRPIFGYVLLAPKPEDITAVLALPITTEKEFLDLCERANRQKPKLAGKEKDIYELPPLDPRYKSLMRFSEQYAYIAYGAKPAPALEPKVLVPMQNIYVPTEKGLIAGRIHFDRIPLAVKLALPTLMGEVKKTILEGLWIGRQDQPIVDAVMPEVEKLVARYAKLAEGADVLAGRLNIDAATGNLVLEATLNGKPGSDLAAIIAARKPTGNQFGGLLNTPDTIAGLKLRMPFFEEEIRSAVAAGIDAGTKNEFKNAPENSRPFFQELVKGIMRTVKGGQYDIVGGIRGPDKNDMYTAVGAIAFEDTAALETAFKKLIENDAPAKEKEAFKWDVAKVGKIGIHTWKPEIFFFDEVLKLFGGDDHLLAFAFAPKGVFLALGPDPVSTLKEALNVKPADSPVLDMVVNPARLEKLFSKLDKGRNRSRFEAIFGKEDKLKSIMSMTVEGGQELKATYKFDLRLIPRAMFLEGIERDAQKLEK